MPTCVKCSQSFNKYVFNDGAKKRLPSGRRLCLKCSPYRQRYISKKKLDLTKKILTCTKCRQSYNRSGAANLSLCASCVVNSRRTSKKELLVKHKGGSCLLCGYNKCINALVFHHVDGHTKDFTISGNHSLSLERLKAEVDKCVLLCCNCHTEVHNGVSFVSV